MKILVVGGGGREHAIAWRLALSPSVSRVFVTPGNPGCAEVADCVECEQTPAGWAGLAKELAIDLTIVGPETPLVDGIVDQFEKQGLLVFGPSRAAAQLEGSKIFAKEFMERAGIPTARFAATDDATSAIEALADFRYPVVVKADGLAAGKGVVICENRASAEQTVRDMFSGALVGNAGARVVLEEFLEGEEVSFIGLSDGERVLPLEPSQDHKRIFDNDEGPNTGGMGAYSDSRLLTDEQRADVMGRVMQRVVDRMRAEGTPFKGFLYAGLMMTKDGPQVLEFNVRLGDPETQALLHRMDCDFAQVLFEAARGEVKPELLRFKQDPSVCVVMAAAGYPGKVRSGDKIFGLGDASGAAVFHAGTKFSGDDIVTAGGRVLGVTSSGATLREAIDNTYAACEHIHFEGMQMRRDIGAKGLARWR